MQWFLNLLYSLLSSFFSLIGSVSAPSWVSDLALNITRFCVITNFYFPLDTLVTVVLSVISVTIVLMIISALLQIF